MSSDQAKPFTTVPSQYVGSWMNHSEKWEDDSKKGMRAHDYSASFMLQFCFLFLVLLYDASCEGPGGLEKDRKIYRRESYPKDLVSI